MVSMSRFLAKHSLESPEDSNLEWRGQNKLKGKCTHTHTHTPSSCARIKTMHPAQRVYSQLTTPSLFSPLEVFRNKFIVGL
jgi:hypothetical protein